MIFVAGYHASGKSVVADLLKDEFNCLHVESSDITRGHWEAAGKPGNIHEWARSLTEYYGADYFNSIIAENILESYRSSTDSGSSIQDIVFTGARSLQTIQYVTSSLDGQLTLGRPNIIIGVEAEYGTLLSRYRERNRRPGDNGISEQTFSELIAGERGRGLDDILAVADYSLQNNNADRNEFLDSIRALLSQELGMERLLDYPRDYHEQTREQHR